MSIAAQVFVWVLVGLVAALTLAFCLAWFAVIGQLLSELGGMLTNRRNPEG